MPRIVPLLLLSLGVAGCATFDEPTPAGYAGPTVDIQDTVQTQSARLAYIFELVEVDGRRVRGSSLATAAANQGRGFNQSAVALSHKFPLVPAKVTLRASTQYAAPILAMTNPSCSVTGTVEFRPEAGKRYAVNGRVTRDHCVAWIEDEQGKVPVTQEVSGPGAK